MGRDRTAGDFRGLPGWGELRASVVAGAPTDAAAATVLALGLERFTVRHAIPDNAFCQLWLRELLLRDLMVRGQVWLN